MSTTRTLFRRPSLELLETRLAPAVHTWSGAAGNLWSDDANWDGGSPAGDPKAELVFLREGQNRTNVNDLSDLVVQSIHFGAYSPPYMISGNSLVLAGGLITVDPTGISPHSIRCDLILQADLTIQMNSDGFNPGKLSLPGRISGPYGMTVRGQGRLELGRANTYSGESLLQGGVVRVSGDSPFGTGMLTFDGGGLEPRGATIANPFTVAPSRGATINGEGGLVMTGPGFLGSGLAIFVGASTTFAGNLSGNGSLGWTSFGRNFLTLAGFNTYTGSTLIGGMGTLVLTSDTSLPATTALTLLDRDSRLDLRGFNATIGSLAGNGDVILGTGSLTVGSDNMSRTFGGVTSGQGSVTKVGVGTWTLSGNSTFTGGLTAAAGTVRLANRTAAGFGPMTTIEGTVEVAAAVTLPNSVHNEGTLRVLTGRTLDLFPGFLTNAGLVEVHGDGVIRTGGRYDQIGGATLLFGGRLDVGNLMLGEGTYFAGYGVVEGSLDNAGVVDVGGSRAAGELRILGDYNQTSTGSLWIELGDAATDNYDRLSVFGLASFAGSLDVLLLDDFVIREGDEFNILSWGTTSGGFDVFNPPDLGEFFLDALADPRGLTLRTTRG